jgi:hypothetical protein
MRTPLILLKIIAKVALHASGVGGLWSILVEEGPELANNVWNEWSRIRNPRQRRKDLEDLALLDDDIVIDVEAILVEVAADQPEPIRKELASYLAQIPGSVRQTLRRPADPMGQTVPPGFEPRSGRDLIPFLSAGRPQFQAGGRPIPGADGATGRPSSPRPATTGKPRTKGPGPSSRTPSTTPGTRPAARLEPRFTRLIEMTSAMSDG